jgi:hypothetical protein
MCPGGFQCPGGASEPLSTCCESCGLANICCSAGEQCCAGTCIPGTTCPGH